MRRGAGSRAEVLGSVGKQDGVLVIRRIHCKYLLKAADADGEAVQRAFELHPMPMSRLPDAASMHRDYDGAGDRLADPPRASAGPPPVAEARRGCAGRRLGGRVLDHGGRALDVERTGSCACGAGAGFAGPGHSRRGGAAALPPRGLRGARRVVRGQASRAQLRARRRWRQPVLGAQRRWRRTLWTAPWRARRPSSEPARSGWQRPGCCSGVAAR